MSTSYAEKVFGEIMDSHEWTYDEITSLMELLDEKQMELSRQEDTSPEEVILPYDYDEIQQENGNALLDNI